MIIAKCKFESIFHPFALLIALLFVLCRWRQQQQQSHFTNKSLIFSDYYSMVNFSRVLSRAHQFSLSLGFFCMFNLKVGHVTITAIAIMIPVTVTYQCHRLTIDNLQRLIIHRQPHKLPKKPFSNAYGH